MKNICITAVTALAFATAPVLAGEPSMSMDNAFTFSKSSQSGGSALASFGSSPSSFEGANAGILLGLAALAVIIFAASGGGGDGGTSSYGAQ